MKLEKLDLNEYGKIAFEMNEDDNIMRSNLEVKPGVSVSVITNSPKKTNRVGGAYGDWNEQTFEMAILIKNRFATVEKISQIDEDYMINGGIWPHLKREEIIEKIKLIKENC